MPPINPDHLSPSGMRVMPRPQQEQAESVLAPVPPTANQLNADISAYIAELESLRRLVMLKVIEGMGE